MLFLTARYASTTKTASMNVCATMNGNSDCAGQVMFLEMAHKAIALTRAGDL